MEELNQEVRIPVGYEPSKSQLLKDYNIEINFFSRGCLIRVGCKSIPFETVEAAMEALNKYVNDPYNEIKKWEKILN